MSTRTKIITIASVLVASNMIAAGVLLLWPAHPVPAHAPAASSPIPIRIPVSATGTVLSAMQAYQSASSTFIYSGTEHPGLGFFVESIDGQASADGKYWILYVNGESASLGASAAHVVPGDLVEWRFEKGIY